MNKRLLLRLLGVLAAAAPARAAEPTRPNVLLILVDDLKPATGSYGDRLARTPNLDRLAARGLQFDLAYCNQAVCAPSRLNLLIGGRSTSTGLYALGNNLREFIPGAVTLPQHFERHGYRAESLGKVFHIGHGNRGDAPSFSVPHFKDKVIEYLLPGTTGGRLTREEAYFENAETGAAIRDLPRGAAWESPDVPDERYADGRVAAETIRRLRAAKDRTQPFLIAAGFVRPHLPFSAPKKYWDLHARAAFPLAAHPTGPAGAPPYAPKPPLGELNNYTPLPERPPVDEETQRSLIHGYYASTSYVDAQIGSVLDALRELRLEENTIVVLWGDHGFSLGTHGLWTKHTNYEEANRIPLILAGPGIARGARTRTPAETVDIFPTLAELAGIPRPAGPQPIDGTSLAAVARDPAAKVKDHVYHAFPRTRQGREVIGRAIRTERYRLVEWKAPGGDPASAEFELYDYEADPLESENRAAREPQTVARLREILARHPEAKPSVRGAGRK
ncbi:MAG: sulfatase [Opitutaceae bacterium]